MQSATTTWAFQDWATGTAAWGTNTANEPPRVGYVWKPRLWWRTMLERARYELARGRWFYPSPVVRLVQLCARVWHTGVYAMKHCRWRSRWERNPLNKRAQARR